MVCPNCKSDQIIQVQDQHYCINCGQQLPEEVVKKAAPVASTAGVAVQPNGLPEGVQILPVGSTPPAGDPAPAPEAAAPEAPEPATEPPAADASVPVIKTRARLAETPTGDGKDDKPKRRKPGRPKAGPLDTPRGINLSAPAPAAALPGSPKIAQAPATGEPPVIPSPPPTPQAPDGPRRMSDISPRRSQPDLPDPQQPPSKPAKASKKRSKSSKANKTHFSLHLPKIHRHNVHKVGVPPLHYGAVLAFSLRARVRPRLFVLAALAAISFAAATTYGVWLFYTGGMPHLSQLLTTQGQKVVIEIALLGCLYYIGRSISQAAIIFGVAREADQRPVTLARQFGVGINTFGSRLVLDLGFIVIELGLLALMAGLVISGGESWSVNLQLQVAAIFTAFLVLLYLETGFGIARGLAGVVLTLTPEGPGQAAKLGWRLFSHRFELLGLRFLAVAIELLLALPLVVVAAALIADAPANLHIEAAVAIGLLALVAGALFGAGTAAWWASLYRRLVLVDHGDGAVALLSGRHSQDARRGPLALIVSLTTILIAAILALPWLNFP
jgi:hypothetical protein